MEHRLKAISSGWHWSLLAWQLWISSKSWQCGCIVGNVGTASILAQVYYQKTSDSYMCCEILGFKLCGLKKKSYMYFAGRAKRNLLWAFWQTQQMKTRFYSDLEPEQCRGINKHITWIRCINKYPVFIQLHSWDTQACASMLYKRLQTDTQETARICKVNWTPLLLTLLSGQHAARWQYRNIPVLPTHVWTQTHTHIYIKSLSHLAPKNKHYSVHLFGVGEAAAQLCRIHVNTHHSHK